jgi:hypothetical protein
LEGQRLLGRDQSNTDTRTIRTDMRQNNFLNSLVQDCITFNLHLTLILKNHYYTLKQDMESQYLEHLLTEEKPAYYQTTLRTYGFITLQG